MDRRRLRVTCRWLRNLLVLWGFVLLFAIVSMVYPYVEHAVRVGYLLPTAVRGTVVQLALRTEYLHGHLTAFGITVVLVALLEVLLRTRLEDP